MPSRATLLTGHHQFGVESMRMEGPYPGSTYDPERCPFWPRIFRQHGYVTAQVGKWHRGPTPALAVTGTIRSSGTDRIIPTRLAVILRPAGHLSRWRDQDHQTLFNGPVHRLDRQFYSKE